LFDFFSLFECEQHKSLAYNITWSGIHVDDIKISIIPGMVALAYNHSYFRSEDQEDHGLRPTWAKSSRDPILINGLTWWCVPDIIRYTGKHK
jgi:hypothetical protein